MDVKEFFKLNILKVFMTIFLIIISFEILMGIFTPEYSDTSAIVTIIIFIASILIGYLIACTIDYFVKSRVIKIVIAVILAVIAIILGWFSLARNIMVCDPVHDPGPVVCDPVHVP